MVFPSRIKQQNTPRIAAKWYRATRDELR